MSNTTLQAHTDMITSLHGLYLDWNQLIVQNFNLIGKKNMKYSFKLS